MKIHDLPSHVRPREKALRYGIESLTDKELLALLINNGVSGASALEIAEKLLTTYQSMYSLSTTNFESLKEHYGLSVVKSINLLATFEFHHRLCSPMYQHLEAISSAQDVYLRYKYLETFDQEVFIILMLDKQLKILKEKILYKGTSKTLSIDVAEIIREFLIDRCSSYILIHNHPDGSQEPSDADVTTTMEINMRAEELGFIMIDHLIIYGGGYYSFNENQVKIGRKGRK